MRFWLPLGVAVALVVGVGAWLATRPGTPATSTNPSSAGHNQPLGAGLPKITGQEAHGFRLPSLRGGAPVTLAAHTPVVLNFFASWCHGCREELDAFAAESKAAGGKVDFVGVDTGETSQAAARRLLAAAGASYPVGVDAHSTVTDSYRILALPTTVFIGRSGKVVGEVFGPQSRHDLARWLRKLGA